MNELKKTVTVFSGTALMLNIVIGAGLLALPGLAVKTAGNAAIYSWMVCSVIAIPLLYIFVIMGKRYPNAGGVAHFAQKAFGFHMYCISSFLFLGAVLFGLPSIALTGGHYVSSIINISPTVSALILLIAATGMNLVSTSFSSKFSTFIASTMIIVLLGIVVIGFMSIDFTTAAERFAAPSELEISSVFAPFMMIFFAFTGWEVAAGISEEFKNPKRDFPRAMFLSFIAACLLYFSMAFVVQSLSISSSYESAFVSVVSIKFGYSGGLFTGVIAALIIFANLTAAIWAVSRMIFSLSRENILPLNLAVHNNGSPISAVILTTATLLLVLLAQWIGLINLEKMLSLSGQNFLLLYGVTSMSLFRLTNVFSDKLFSLIAISVVMTVIITAGQSLYYPIFITIVAIIVASFSQKVVGNTS